MGLMGKVVGTDEQVKNLRHSIVSKVKKILDVWKFNTVIISSNPSVAEIRVYRNDEIKYIYFGFYDDFYRILVDDKNYKLYYSDYVYACDFTDDKDRDAILGIIDKIKEL